MSDDLLKRLDQALHFEDWMPVPDNFSEAVPLLRESRSRIEELEAKLALSEGALDVASRSWGECQRVLGQTEAKLAKCEALMHAGLAEYQRRLVRAVRLIQFLDKEYQHVWGVTAKSEVRTVLAELEGELDE